MYDRHPNFKQPKLPQDTADYAGRKKKNRYPPMERKQSLASQQGAMAGAVTRACWGNSSVNSST